jgi:hypothetical protein
VEANAGWQMLKQVGMEQQRQARLEVVVVGAP